MKKLAKKILTIGIEDSQESFDQQRIRWVNAFCITSLILLFIFGLLNLTIGENTQALLIFSGSFTLALPPLLLNKIGKIQMARYYFVAVGLLFTDAVIFRASLHYQNRYNEIFLVGLSTLIVVLLDNPAKAIFLLLSLLSTLIIIHLNLYAAGLPVNNDTYMAYLNTFVAYGGIYFLISIYKHEHQKSVENIKKYNTELESQRKQILQQRDEIFANRIMIRSAIDAMPLFISLLDMEGHYLLVNSRYEKAFGKKIAEIEGNHYTDVLPENILKMQRGLIEKALNGEVQEFDHEFELLDGTPYNGYGKYIPIYNQNNEQYGIAIYTVNVTKLKNIEVELRSLNQTKNRLLSIISHDVKSPLNSLKGLMSISNSIKTSELAHFNNTINEQLKTVLFNVDNLLNWAKNQMKGFTSNPEIINIKNITIHCIDLYNEDLKKKSITLNTNFEGPEEAFTDKESLKLVIRNLLNNAIKFTPSQGKIDVLSYENEKGVIIDIVDNGIGLTEKSIKELERGATSIESKLGTMGESGTGIGLSLSIELIKLNKGNLHLLNNKSTGTTARIILPKHELNTLQE